MMNTRPRYMEPATHTQHHTPTNHQPGKRNRNTIETRSITEPAIEMHHVKKTTVAQKDERMNGRVDEKQCNDCKTSRLSNDTTTKAPYKHSNIHITLLYVCV